MNKMVEIDCYETLKSCLEHPNIEIIQLAERPSREVVTEDGERKKGKKKGRKTRDEDEDESLNESNVSLAVKNRLYKEIFVAFQQSEALKQLEFRFIVLDRKMLQQLFRALARNKSL